LPVHLDIFNSMDSEQRGKVNLEDYSYLIRKAIHITNKSVQG